MHRPRFTIRRVMVTILVVAVLLGATKWVYVMRERSALYRRRAWEFKLMTRRAGSSVTTKDGRRVSMYDTENDFLMDAWTIKLAEKNWRLATYPWLPVEPDPPPPEMLANPRSAVDLPPDFGRRRWKAEVVFPWWTFLWTWRTG